MILDILKMVNRITIDLHSRGFSLLQKTEQTIVQIEFATADYLVLSLFLEMLALSFSYIRTWSISYGEIIFHV